MWSKAVGQLLARRPIAWSVCLIASVVLGGAAYFATQLQQDDDILAFLPQDAEEVVQLKSLAARFKSLDVILVGVVPRSGDTILVPQHLTALATATRQLETHRYVSRALSLANVQDFETDAATGTLVTKSLIMPDEIARLVKSDQRQLTQRKLVERPQIVGNLIAADMKSAVLYVFTAGPPQQRPMTIAAIRKTVEHSLNPEHYQLHWGGAPIIANHLLQETRAQVNTLSLIASIVIFIVAALFFRSVIGTLLAMLATCLAITMALAGLALFGGKLDLVLSSLPIVLFAVGSAYAIHMLAACFRYAHEEQMVQLALQHTGKNLIVAAFTTAASLSSFVMMDVAPMRRFGLVSAAGVLCALFAALIVLPAACALLPRRLLKSASPRGGALSQAIMTRAMAHRRWIIIASVAAALAAPFVALRLDSRVDPLAMLPASSPVRAADRFLGDNYGGSQFMLVRVTGDATDPSVLRQLDWLANELALVRGVSQVSHVGEVLKRANEAMEGQRRLPDSRAKAKLLYAFVAADPAIQQMLTKDYREMLLHVRLRTSERDSVKQLSQTVESLLQRRRSGGELPTNKTRVATAVRALLAGQSVVVGDRQAIELIDAMPKRAPGARLVDAVVAFIKSPQCPVPVPTATDAMPRPALRLARELLASKSRGQQAYAKAIAKLFGWPMDGDDTQDLADALATAVAELKRDVRDRHRASWLLGRLNKGGLQRRLANSLSGVLSEADAPGLTASKLGYAVSGLPLVNRALERSATSNQRGSAGFSLIAVFLIAAIAFRSLAKGLVVALPCLLTLTLVFGGMIAFGVSLDLGTAMIASLVLGIGVDYAVHLLAAREDAEGSSTTAFARAGGTVGSAIWANALSVGLGFSVLTMSTVAPLRYVGGITAAAMLICAAVTLITVPALSHRNG